MPSVAQADRLMENPGRIISGGQTGVDRGALDAALATGFPIGGYCPVGRAAEDGVIPDRYALTELKRGGPLERTLMNVAESDGTVILYFELLSGGTEKTLQACLFLQRPYLLLDAELCLPEAAADRIRGFCKLHRIGVLNVAGPRASEWDDGFEFARETISELLSR
jgi:Circularly permutated YpsA SLOG family